MTPLTPNPGSPGPSIRRYRLKPGQPGFAITDGPLAPHSYLPGITYRADQIPARLLERFAPVAGPKPQPAAPSDEAAPETGPETQPAAPAAAAWAAPADHEVLVSTTPEVPLTADLPEHTPGVMPSNPGNAPESNPGQTPEHKE